MASVKGFYQWGAMGITHLNTIFDTTPPLASTCCAMIPDTICTIAQDLPPSIASLIWYCDASENRVLPSC
jgi:hypothetical protein